SNLRRSWMIVALFSGFFAELGWIKVLRKFKSEEYVQARLNVLYANQAIRFRHMALEMEGLLIKIGQFFSTRVDILPVEYTRELAQLQDEVPPIPFTGISRVIEREFGDSPEKIFTSINPEPVAAASLGQVHRGTLPSGEDVAIKVLRPGIEEIIKVDLRAFRHVIRMLKVFTDWNKTIDLKALYDEFSKTVLAELDYAQERANLERFRKNFAKEKKITVPKVYDQYSRKKVLTMQYITGYKVTDTVALRAAGIDLAELARRLVNSYLKQVLVDGFFHADPHPGNLFVRPDGTVVFIDFGMVGRIPPGGKEGGQKMIKAILDGDPELLTESFVDLGVIRPHANMISLRRGLSILLAELRKTSFDDLGNLKVDKLLAELREFVYAEPFQIPSNYTFLGRAVGTLTGLAAGLDPSMNILELVRPYTMHILGEDQQSWTGVALHKAKEIGGSLVALPPLLEKTLHQAQTGDLYVRTELGPVLRAIRFQGILVNRLVWTVLLATSAIISTLFKLKGYTIEARDWTYVAGGFGVLLLLNLRKRAEKPLRIPEGHKSK
ncbi:MAG TPA: AarF/ABC1/UbiB kinase family protein, partial [Desulfobacteria bacterium]|nr:AarF/ABC1/UbiB kinase family protein [Desulfobacteria bacterium]